jgi:ferritin-like metal-binding protein YciE
MTASSTLYDAFLDELRDTYHAEVQITKALPKMLKAASSPRRARRSRASRRSSRAWARRCAPSPATGWPAS